ncbi:hypothetical protein QR680_001779 [Steinernema hermaphroditum]|uniref:Nuclear transcription factor Y subunit n=1 Tax=Steinernema hermaphroditum TaxID=289476 RepID=A0AA39H0Q6_9BILA|nr:hypothetical protein QR680_001779 [Steinernema hermaphroditum]
MTAFSFKPLTKGLETIVASLRREKGQSPRACPILRSNQLTPSLTNKMSLSHGGQHHYVQHHRSPSCSVAPGQQNHTVTPSAQCQTQDQYPSMRFVPTEMGCNRKFLNKAVNCDSVSADGSCRSPDPYQANGTKIVDYQNVCQMIPQEGGSQPIIIQLVPSASSSSSVVAQPAPAQIPEQTSAKEEEPLYVNAKQYNRILKRRLTRAKLEQQGLIPKERRKYLHESRHKHALKRQRGEGGKFDSSGSFSEDAASPKENCVISPGAITEQVRTVFRPASCDEDSRDILRSDPA